MATVTHKSYLNMVSETTKTPVIHVGQYDDDFTIEFYLIAVDGKIVPKYPTSVTSNVTFSVPNGATAEVRGTKRDGNGYSANATISTVNQIKCVTVTGHQQMTACAGENIFEIVLKYNNKVISTANFILDVERAAMDADTIQSDTVLKELDAIINSASISTAAAAEAEDAADRAEAAAATLEIDDTLTHTGQAADAKKVGDELSDLKDDLSDVETDLDNTMNRVANVIDDTLGSIRGKLDSVYSAFTIAYDNVEDLMDENGDLIEFPFIRLKDYFTKEEIENLISPLGEAISDIDEATKAIIDSIFGYEDVESLMDENGELIEFPFNRLDKLDNYLTESEARDLIEEELETVSTFKPEDYQYNSTTAGYYAQLPTPILYLDGDVSEMTKDKKAKLDARYNDIHMGCSCKWQGASSIAYPKKNYTVTFNSPVLIKSEWGSKKKYVLKSEFADSTHTRNTVAAKIWADIVRDRELTNGLTTLDDESGIPITLEDGTTVIDVVDSQILGSPGRGCNDGFHVMVVINGDYQGLYTLGIPKDDWMFGMDNGSENCCILNAEANTEPTRFRATTTKAAVEGEQTFSLEYASDDMDIDRIVSSLNTMLTSVINASGSNYRSAIEPYFDVDSAIDYFIYSLLIGNWDGVSHNFNLATYDGTQWMFSAYDLDNTFGIEDLVNWKFENLFDDPADSTPTIPIAAETNRFFWLIYTYGTAEFKARYQHLRSNVLSERHIFTRFYNHLSTVSKRVLEEEFNVWPTTPRSGSQTVDAYINWYRLRCDYMDAKVAAL